jgi:hypothetical protein
MSKHSRIGAALALGLFATQASATILLGVVNTIAQNSAPAGFATPTLLDLNGAVAGSQTTVTFITSLPGQRVTITFNAECAVGGVSDVAWLDVDILVDPAGPTAAFVVPPSDGDNALCTANGTPGNDGWVSGVVNATTTVRSAGVHTIQVRVTGQSGAPDSNWRVDDTSLIIETD